MVGKKSSLASQLFSDSVVPLGIGVGVILIWIASLVAVLATGADAGKAVNVLKDTGLALVSMMMIGGGVTLTEKERSVRIAMVVMGTLVFLYLIPSVSMAGLL
jgi:hypothetical protein